MVREMASAHQVLCEGDLGVEAKVKSTASTVSTRDPASAPPARRSGVRFDVAVVGVRHDFTSFGVTSKRFGLVSCCN